MTATREARIKNIRQQKCSHPHTLSSVFCALPASFSSTHHQKMSSASFLSFLQSMSQRPQSSLVAPVCWRSAYWRRCACWRSGLPTPTRGGARGEVRAGLPPPLVAHLRVARHAVVHASSPPPSTTLLPRR
jgi:hypothetical protein